MKNILFYEVWVELRGPDEPALEIGVNSLTRRQANYMTTVLGGPAALHEHANLGTPLVLHVHGHTLTLGAPDTLEQAEVTWACSVNSNA